MSKKQVNFYFAVGMLVVIAVAVPGAAAGLWNGFKIGMQFFGIQL